MLGPCNFVCRLTLGNRQAWVWTQLSIIMITKSQQFVKASLDHTLLPILYSSQTVSPPPTLSFHSHSVCGGNPHDLLALGKAGSEGRRASRDGTNLQMPKCSHLLPAAHVPRAAGAGDGDVATSGIQYRVSRDHQASARRNRNDALSVYLEQNQDFPIMAGAALAGAAFGCVKVEEELQLSWKWQSGWPTMMRSTL